jgi:hypothetical protein
MKIEKRVKLDWSRLFGFSQVQSVQAAGHETKQARAALAAKIGAKPGVKVT